MRSTARSTHSTPVSRLSFWISLVEDVPFFFFFFLEKNRRFFYFLKYMNKSKNRDDENEKEKEND